MTKGTPSRPEHFVNTGIPVDPTGNIQLPSDSYHQPWIRDGKEDKDEALIAWYSRLLKEQGLSAASRGVYVHLAGRIAQDFHIRQHKTLTARELSRNCRGKLYCRAFSRFVAVYERIRYGGKDSGDDLAAFETALTSADELMEREKH